MHRRRFAAVISLFLLVFSAAAHAEEPQGIYRAEGRLTDGKPYAGKVQIAREGRAVHLAWQLENGPGYLGLGLQLDEVLGAVYWPAEAKSASHGIVVYRIDGGRLTGSWTVSQVPGHLAGREELLGPAGLEGRFEIAIGENPGGASHYKGHVEISRMGDIFHFRWFTPKAGYVGSGIRMGDVMVVGFAAGRAPSTVAYCIQGEELDGSWFVGEGPDRQMPPLGREILRKEGSAATGTASFDGPTDCTAQSAMIEP